MKKFTNKIKKSLLSNKEISIAAVAAVSTWVGNMVIGGECKLFTASVIFALVVNMILFIKWTKQEEFSRNGKKVKAALVIITIIFIICGFYCKFTNHKKIEAPVLTQTLDDEKDDNIVENNEEKDQPVVNTQQPSKNYTPVKCPEKDKIDITKTITDDSKTDTKVTVEKDEPVKVEVKDNSEEDKKTDEAVEKAKDENINIVEGDVKDKNGKPTGDKIIATEGHTSGTELDLNTDKDDEPKKDDKKENTKVDVSQSKPSEKVNKNENIQSNETETSNEKLNEIFGVKEDIVKEEKVEIESVPNVTVVEPETKQPEKTEEPKVEDVAKQEEVEEEIKEVKKPVEVKALDGYETYINSSIQFKISGDVDSIDGLDGIDYSFNNGILTINTGSEATTLSIDVNGENTVSFDLTINGIVK